ncbi:hypothetical protein HMPREF3039_01596 [Akkermansia sp. KLE1798]|nr:hypothetical protein HMPREF3039_01596 [Akkermansia sp. KLE1798]
MRYDSLAYTSISGFYCWKSAGTNRQDTPLFLTGSGRKVNLASLKRSFFFRDDGDGVRPSARRDVPAACGRA